MALPTRLNTANEVLAEADEFGVDSGTDDKIGDLGEGGITFAVETEENEVRSGSQREIYVYIRGSTSPLWRGDLLNINTLNFAFALGENEDTTNITGSGTLADPFILAVNPDLFGEQIARTYYATGTRVDANIVRMEATTGRVFAPSVEWTMAQGAPTVIPFVIRVTGAWQIHEHTPT